LIIDEYQIPLQTIFLGVTMIKWLKDQYWYWMMEYHIEKQLVEEKLNELFEKAQNNFKDGWR